MPYNYKLFLLRIVTLIVIFLKPYIYLPNTSARTGCYTRTSFKRILTGLNSEFSFSENGCHTKVKELNLPYYLHIARGRLVGFIPFPRILALCEMQTTSSRFLTRVAVSISYNDNHYTTSTTLTPYNCAKNDN